MVGGGGQGLGARAAGERRGAAAALPPPVAVVARARKKAPLASPLGGGQAGRRASRGTQGTVVGRAVMVLVLSEASVRSAAGD